MSEVLLSVIIPAYHSEATIKETIESIYREFESEINYEIIVVENGPEDQTTQVLEKLMCKGIPVKLFTQSREFPMQETLELPGLQEHG